MASGWNALSEEYQSTLCNMYNNPPKRSTSDPPKHPNRHVGFKEDVEEVRQYARETSMVRPNDSGFQANEENIDKEADEFIKYEHKKFQWSRTMSAYSG